MAYRDQGIYFDNQQRLMEAIATSVEDRRMEDANRITFSIDRTIEYTCIKDIPGTETWETRNNIPSFRTGRTYRGTTDRVLAGYTDTYVTLFKRCAGCSYREKCSPDIVNSYECGAEPMTEKFFREHFISSKETQEARELDARKVGEFNGWTKDTKCFQCGSSLSLEYFKIWDSPWIKAWKCDNCQIVSYSGNKMYTDYYNESKVRKYIWLYDHQYRELCRLLKKGDKHNGIEIGMIPGYFFREIGKPHILSDY